MPSLSFFADEADLDTLEEQLNDDPEIAFVVPRLPLTDAERLAILSESAGQPIPGAFGAERVRRFMAIRRVDRLPDGDHLLWHIPAGDLYSMEIRTGLRCEPAAPIEQPWDEWEARCSVNPDIPMVGAGEGHHGLIHLSLWTRHKPYSEDERRRLPITASFWAEGSEFLAASDFQWIGSHYRPAPPQTKRWWSRLKRWMEKNSVRLSTSDRRVSFYAFPSALRRLQRGIRYHSRNYDLTESIRNSVVH